MKKVLIVEDDSERQIEYKEKLGGSVIVLQAVTAKQAFEILEKEGETIDLVTLDFYLDDHDVSKTTVELTMNIRSQFKNIIMIAASGHKESRNTQVEMLGCHHESPKENLPEKILKLITNQIDG